VSHKKSTTLLFVQQFNIRKPRPILILISLLNSEINCRRSWD